MGIALNMALVRVVIERCQGFEGPRIQANYHKKGPETKRKDGIRAWKFGPRRTKHPRPATAGLQWIERRLTVSLPGTIDLLTDGTDWNHDGDDITLLAPCIPR
jgi:hypothetical protein